MSSLFASLKRWSLVPLRLQKSQFLHPRERGDAIVASLENAGGDRSLESVMREGFNSALYLEKYPDVKLAELDPLSHYLEFGCNEGRAPNQWFDPALCLAMLGEVGVSRAAAFQKLAEHAFASGKSMQESYAALRDATLAEVAELETKRSLLVRKPLPEDLELVRPYFDADYYLENYPLVASSGVDPLVHYMTVGWLAGNDPSAEFSTSYYLRHNKDIRLSGANPLKHFAFIQQKGIDRWRRHQTVAGARTMSLFEEGGVLAETVAEAIQLEPMVAFPQDDRRLTSTLLASAKLASFAKSNRVALGSANYEYVITVANIRMSGAARVASIFAQEFGSIVGIDKVLLVVTDTSDLEYDDWLPKDLQVFDFASQLDGASSNQIQIALYDMLRGIGAKTLININSRAAWDLCRGYGRQLSQEFNLVTYLFTWDETPEGIRGGYPIQWLRDTSGFHDVILTDTEALADDIRCRFAFNKHKVRALYTPVQKSGEVLAPPLVQTACHRFLWAGRFDPQKRVDILFAIAKENPDVIFDAYGKSVLGGSDQEMADPPPNINFMGAYKSLDEVLNTYYHGFVYTAQWDGLPTILLDIAQAGLPIIAPAVGGIPELISPESGWLIDDFTDVAGYSRAIKEVANDPDGALKRSKRLRAVVKTKFASKPYQTELKKVVERYGL